MSPGGAFVPDGGGSLPAIHHTSAVPRTMAAGAAAVRGVGRANGCNNREHTRYQNGPHVLPPSLAAQSSLHPAPAVADRLVHSTSGSAREQLGASARECIRTKGTWARAIGYACPSWRIPIMRVATLALTSLFAFSSSFAMAHGYARGGAKLLLARPARGARGYSNHAHCRLSFQAAPVPPTATLHLQAELGIFRRCCELR